jgi:hypothetical protein
MLHVLFHYISGGLESMMSDNHYIMLYVEGKLSLNHLSIVLLAI